MRQHLAKLASTFLVGGCSLIYNPSNIDKPMIDARMIDMGEVPVDIEIRADAMPRDLSIMEAFPTTIDEGSGIGGSRTAVVVLRGHNFVKDAAASLMVTIAPATSGAAVLDNWEVAGNGDYIALSLTVPIATTCADGTSVDVDVTVTQKDLMDQPVTAMLDNAFAVRCLDELDAAPASATGLKALYSRIAITGALDFPAATASAALLRSASSISIGGALDGSATGVDPGPGGGAGGVASTVGSGPRPGSGATAGNGAGGGGAGFLTAGGAGGTGPLGAAGAAPGLATGDSWISKYTDNGGSGGGGGGSYLTSAGGIGGGAGGTIELTAPGDVSVGAVTANGAAGTQTGGGDGGAGTGGVVLVRAGNMLTMSTVSVANGVAGGTGGVSSDGRVRVDAAKGAYPTGATTCVFPFSATCNLAQGPMFVDLPGRTTNQMLAIVLRGTPNDATSTLRVFDKAGNPVAGPGNVSTYTPTFGTSGQASVMPTLKAGYNKVCVWVAGGGPGVDESINCQDIAYLPL